MRRRLILILIVGLAIGTRLFGVGQRPLDGDEGVILEAATRPTFIEVIKRTQDDAHPPAQAIATYIILQALPLSETTARLPSVFFGGLAVIGLYLLIKTYVDQAIAQIGGLLAATSPYLVFYAQEQRMYSLLLSSSIFSLWFLERFIASPERRLLIGLVVTSTIMIYTHHLGLVILAGLIIGVAIDWRRTRPVARQLASALVILALLYLPQLPTTIHQVQGRVVEQAVGPMIADNLVGLGNLLFRLGAGRLILGLEPSPSYFISLINDQPKQAILLLLATLAPLITLMVGYRYLRRQVKSSVVIPLSVVLTVILAALFSQEIGARAVRTLIVLAPVYFTFLAAGLVLATKRKTGYWLVVAIFLIFSLGLKQQLTVEGRAPGANAIARFLAEHARPGDSVLAKGAFLTGESFVLNYYLKQTARAPKLMLHDFFGDYRVGNLAELKNHPVDEAVTKLKTSGQTVWYYDFSYSGDRPSNAAQHSLGVDKEGQELVVYEIHH